MCGGGTVFLSRACLRCPRLRGGTFGWSPDGSQEVGGTTKDNANVLGAMIKGTSGSQLCDRSAMLTALMCALLRVRIWWEYVQSKSNWSDGASRLLEACPWARRHNFSLVEETLPDWPWLCPISDFLVSLQDCLEKTLG